MHIQRYPAGLQELLRVIGPMPTEAADAVVPAIETLKFYLSRLGLSSDSNSNAATNAPGNLAQVTVPAGEVWWLVAAQAALQATTVGDRARISIGIQADGFQTRVHQGADQTAVNAAARLVAALNQGEPIVLVSGNVVFAAIDDIALAAGNRTLTLSVLFYRLSQQQ